MLRRETSRRLTDGQVIYLWTAPLHRLSRWSLDEPQGDLRIKQSTQLGNTTTTTDDSTINTDYGLASDLNPEVRKTQGIHIHFTTVNEPVRVTTRDGTNITAMPDDTMTDITLLQTNHYLTNSSQRDMTSQPTTKEEAVQTQSSTAFPTDARMKAKKKEEAIKAMGQDPKLLRQRKKILQEQHYDDCGSDFGGIDEKKATVTFADAVHYTYHDPDFDSDDNGSSDAEERLEDDFLNQTYLAWMGFGSTAPDNAMEFVPASAWEVKAEEFLTFLARPEIKGTVDVMEFCGGAAGVSRIAVRRRLKAGMNADIICGIDLTTEKGRRILFKYVEQHKPLVIIGAPPCTSMAGWSHYNRSMNAETFNRNRRIGEELANLYAKLCLLQMAGGRHWLLENPLGSDLFRLKSWKEIEPYAHKVSFHQCLLGLCDQDGVPVRKATQMWASTWVLIHRLHGYICRERHRAVGGTSKGQDRTDFVKVWPRRLCELVVAGIEELRRMPRLAYLTTIQFTPVTYDTECSHTNCSVGSVSLPCLLSNTLKITLQWNSTIPKANR